MTNMAAQQMLLMMGALSACSSPFRNQDSGADGTQGTQLNGTKYYIRARSAWSTDGKTWTVTNTASGSEVRSLAWGTYTGTGGGRWVAVGSAGTIAYSDAP